MELTTGAPPVDLASLVPGLAPYARTATRLHPRPGLPAIDGSHVGGPFLWPADEPWPHCREQHMTLDDLADDSDGEEEDEEHEPAPYLGLAQLRAADVPDLWCPDGTDLLQVLWCPNDHEEEWSPAVRLRWRRAADVTGPLAEPPEPTVVEDDVYLPRACLVHPERVVEYPWWQVLPTDLAEAVASHTADGTDYQYLLSVAPGWKVGGWASWHLSDLLPMDCPTCARPMTLLLTIDSSEWDGGSGPRWRPVQERHLPPGTDAFSDTCEPTGISVGRHGALRVFVCTACPDLPTLLSLQ